MPFAAPVTGAQSPLQQRVETSVHYKSYGAFKSSDEKICTGVLVGTAQRSHLARGFAPAMVTLVSS